MASYSAVKAKHPTLTANTVDTVVLSTRWDAVEIKNRGTTTAPLYVNTGRGGADDVTDPTVAGDDTEIVDQGESVLIEVPVDSASSDTVVKVICSAAHAYSVTGVRL